MSEQAKSQKHPGGPVYPDDPTAVHKTKDMLSATLDLIEPSNIRIPGESEENLAQRIVEAYYAKFAHEKYALPLCFSRDEYATWLNIQYKMFGPMDYEFFKERPLVSEPKPTLGFN